MSISKLAYNFANGYVNTIDTSIDVVTTGAGVTWSCGKAVVNTIANGHGLGITGSITATAKWCFGINNYVNAWKSLKLQPSRSINLTQTNQRVTVSDTRNEYSKRIGDAIGHTFSGLAKAGFTTALVIGEVTMFTNPAKNLETTIGLCQTMATASNAVIVTGGKIGVSLIQDTLFSAYSVCKNTLNDPLYLKNPVVILIAGIGMYAVCDQGVKAANSQGWRKAAHGLAAVASGAVTVTAAFFANSMLNQYLCPSNTRAR